MDALALAEWVIVVAPIPPSRMFGQSLGTAVSVSLARHFANRPTPILFPGVVLVTPMADVQLLTATYRIAGLVTILGPVARSPKVLVWLNTFIRDKWPSKDKLADLARLCEHLPGEDMKYHITVFHAGDDYGFPWSLSDILFWDGAKASNSKRLSLDDLENVKAASRTPLGAGVWSIDWKTMKETVREQIMKYGLHNKVTSYPMVSPAILRAFRGMRPILRQGKRTDEMVSVIERWEIEILN